MRRGAAWTSMNASHGRTKRTLHSFDDNHFTTNDISAQASGAATNRGLAARSRLGALRCRVDFCNCISSHALKPLGLFSLISPSHDPIPLKNSPSFPPPFFISFSSHYLPPLLVLLAFFFFFAPCHTPSHSLFCPRLHPSRLLRLLISRLPYLVYAMTSSTP